MKKLLIIGAGIAGEMLIREILKDSKLSKNYEFQGFLDDNKIEPIQNYPILGKIKDSRMVIQKYSIDEIIIAIPSADKSLLQTILLSYNGCAVTTKIVPPVYEIIKGQFSYKEIRNIIPSDLLGREEVGFDIDKIKNAYEDKIIFVSGAGGSIGSEIVNQLLKLPIKKVVAFGRGENSIHELIQKYKKDERFIPIIGDIRDEKKLFFTIKEQSPDFVFHAAAHKHVPLMEEFPDEAIKNNIIGTYNLCQVSIACSVKKFIMISTDKAVNPSSIMGATKRIAETIALSSNQYQNKTQFLITRFGNVLGSRGSVVPIFQNQIEKGGPITITDKRMSRFFMSIREAARLVIKSGTFNDGKIFVLDMGKPMKIVDLAKSLICLYGLSTDEIKIEYTGLRPGEKLTERLHTKDESLIKTEFNKLLVSDKTQNLLKEEEIDLMIREFRETADQPSKEFMKSVIKKYCFEYTYSPQERS